MISTSRVSYLYPQAGQRVAGDLAFSVPKSPLRAEHAAANKPLAGEKTLADSVELSGVRPDLLGLPWQTTLPLPESERPAFPASNDRTGSLYGEKQRPADGSDDGSLEEADDSGGEGADEAKPGEAVDARGRPLDEEGRREVSELKNRDREVRQHEQAHKAVGGSYAGAISYDYQQGPDGKRYAVGGEVSIDVSAEKDPSATAAKMRQVRAAALAPAEPSGQDLQVAAEASRIESEARQDMSRERTANAPGGGESGQPGSGESAGEDGESAVGSASSASSASEAGAAPENRPSSGFGSPPHARLSALSIGFGVPAPARASFPGRRAIDVFA